MLQNLSSAAVVIGAFRVNSLPPGKFFVLFCHLLIFFKNNFFQNFFQENIVPSEYQIVWFQIRPDILLGLIWVKTVCKSYQQTKQGNKELTHNFTIRQTESKASM